MYVYHVITVFLNPKGAVCDDLRKALMQFKKQSECILSYEPLKKKPTYISNKCIWANWLIAQYAQSLWTADYKKKATH